MSESATVVLGRLLVCCLLALSLIQASTSALFHLEHRPNLIFRGKVPFLVKHFNTQITLTAFTVTPQVKIWLLLTILVTYFRAFRFYITKVLR